MSRSVFPFSAIVGQEQLKLALLLNAVNPQVGGALIMGERGTAKSTAVRGLAALLPPLSAVKGCRFRCDPGDRGSWCSECRERFAGRGEKPPRERVPVPFVELPLGATEDRVLGALDLEAALSRAEKRFEPGLLAAAHRGFLYIDEVNLLPDHLVDLLLDAAQSGRNRVEREGLSVEHPASFVLIGSGNPEEGDLRPQLLDRFGLFVDVRGSTSVAERVEIVRRRDAFERNPAAFRREFEPAERALRGRIRAARTLLRRVEVPPKLVEAIIRVCDLLGVDGHRGELALVRGAATRAALEGQPVVDEGDIRAVAPLALAHRLRKDGLGSINHAAAVEEVVGEVLSAGA